MVKIVNCTDIEEMPFINANICSIKSVVAMSMADRNL
jgi:hypothetical protein